MGTWDLGPFDNDIASDWCADLDEADDGTRIEMIEEALASAADETGYLDGDVAFTAIAAAAVVASQLPNGPAINSAYAPDFLGEGGSLPIPANLPPLAVRALDRIMADDSEWRDLWDEADSLEQATAAIAPIRQTLSQ